MLDFGEGGCLVDGDKNHPFLCVLLDVGGVVNQNLVVLDSGGKQELLVVQ